MINRPPPQTGPGRILTWGRVRNRYDNVVKYHHGSFDDLVEFGRPRGERKKGDNKNGRAIVAGIMCVGRHPDEPEKNPGRRRWRKKALAEGADILMIDVDGEAGRRELDGAAVDVACAGLTCIRYSTYSHGVPGKGHRERIILPLKRRLAPEEHPNLYQWAIEWFSACGVGKLDTGCKDITRLMYTPGDVDPRSTIDPWYYKQEGAWLDPDALPDGQSVGQIIEAQRRAAAEAEAQRQRDAAARRARRRTRFGGRRVALDPSARADSMLSWACDEIRSAGEGERHKTACRVAFAIGGWVGAGVLDRTKAVGDLTCALASVYTRKEASFQDCERRVAHQVDVGAKSPWTIDEDLDAPSPRRSLARNRPPTPEVEADNDDGADAEADDDQAPSPIHKPDPDAVAEEAPPRRRPRRTVTDPELPLMEGRVAVGRALRDALERGGATVIKVPPGGGKSYAARIEGLALLKERGGKAVIRLPDNDNVDEKLIEYREAASPLDLSVARAVVRNEHTCPVRWREVQAAARVHPDGAMRVCRNCPLFPDENGQSECPFWRSKFAEADADIRLETHAFGQMRSPYTWQAGVRVSWSQFWKAREEGGLYRPHVVRTPNGAVVGVRQDNAGQPIPELEEGPYPRWTAQSKRDVAAWIGQRLWGQDDMGVDAVRKRLAHDNHVDRVFIDWSHIVHVSKDHEPGTRMVPHHYYKGEGWHQGWHLTVRPAGDVGGAPMPLIALTETPSIDEASQGRIMAWIARAWGVDATLAHVEEHARAHIDERPYRYLVIDENPWGAVRYGGEFTREQLHELVDAGELEGPWSAVTRAMIKAEASGEGLTSEQLEEVARAATLDVQTTYAHSAEVLDHALDQMREADILACLADAPDWQAVAALASCVASGWVGAYVTKTGRLAVARTQPIDLEPFETVVAIDATTTNLVASALYKAAQDVDRLDFRQVHIRMPSHLEVLHIDYNTGSRSHVWGEDAPDRRRAGAVWLASVARYGSAPGCLNITHKRWLEEGWTAPTLIEAEASGASNIYHGAGEARGSNRYQTHHTARIDAWHVPAQAKVQDAQMLAQMLGLDWRELDEERRAELIGEAEWQLVGAAIEQGAARIRPFDASTKTPKRLVFVDTRPPECWGFTTTERIDPDMLVWQTLGQLPDQRGDDDRATSWPLVADVVARVVDAHGGVYVPGCDLDGPDPTTIRELAPAPSQWPGIGQRWLIDSDTTTADYVATRLKSWIRYHFGRSTRRFAAAAGVVAAVVEHDRPGRGWAAFINPNTPLDRGALESQLAHRGVTRYRLIVDGEAGDWVRMRATTCPLREALSQIRGLDALHDDVPLAAVYDEVAKLADASARSVRRWVADARLEGEDSRACLIRLWHDAVALDRADRVDELATRLHEPAVVADLGRYRVPLDGSARERASTLWDRALGPCPVPRHLARTWARLHDKVEVDGVS